MTAIREKKTSYLSRKSGEKSIPQLTESEGKIFVEKKS
jgi:hypothetical protein